jgi:ABC-type polysaccharide/polyol phosphate export permease
MKNQDYFRQRAKTYFQVITIVAIRNIKLRYKNSALGFLWSLINPLILLGIFIFIFSTAFPDIENYPLYAISGLIFWNFFSTGSNQILNSVIESGGILKSLSVPPIIFPIAALYSALINLLLSLIPFFVLMFWFGFQPGWITIMLLPILILFSLFIYGFGIIICGLNVYYRDIGLFWNTITPALLYITPVAYISTLVPENIRWVMKLNPLYHFMEAFRSVLYYGTMPTAKNLIILSILAFGLSMLGTVLFRKLKKGFISYY